MFGCWWKWFKRGEFDDDKQANFTDAVGEIESVILKELYSYDQLKFILKSGDLIVGKNSDKT